MTGQLRVLSIYEGFFAGGARALHSSVVAGLHAGGSQAHVVLSIHNEMRRETLLQRMETDARYRQLDEAGVPIVSLGRGSDRTGDPTNFTAAELATVARQAAAADIILSLKEQPLHLINRAELPRRPIVVCLHRSDPDGQGAALAELRAAVAAGRIAAAICCAESTKTAYEAAGIPGSLLHVIPNGVDLERFQPPAAPRTRAVRRPFGLPAKANVVTLAARYDPMKDVQLFLRAARAFLQRDPSGHILMCGAGMTTDNPQLRHDIDVMFADEPSLLARIRLLGLRHDMVAVYAATDVVALTSITGEAAPLCLIEGMMCGAVPVTTEVGDCALIVAGHGLTTSHDPAEISAAWSEAIKRRAEFAPALVASRARFSQTRMIASYSALIDRICRGAASIV
jgi:glycosyltransferase involved in cell wall biosynthesis